MLYDIDYPALDTAGKREFVHYFARLANESFMALPRERSWTAQALILTRCRNSYRCMEDCQPEPELIPAALEQIWGRLAGRVPQEDFLLFTKSFSAALLEFMTGDDSELVESAVNQRFYQRYFGEWNHAYTILADALCILCEEIAAGDLSWLPVEQLLYGDIAEDKIESYEEIWCKESGGYTAAELDVRETQVYASPTFCQVVARIQQDMREAASGASPAELEAKSRERYLFPAHGGGE